MDIDDFDAVIFNILDTSETPYNYVDTNNISQIGDAYRAFNRLTGNKNKHEKILRECITCILKGEEFSTEMQRMISMIDRKLLTNKEKIMFDYVKEKNGE